MMKYKQLSLFPEHEGLKELKKSVSKSDVFNDYDTFLKKFEAKKTTDDCYTPEGVYETVLDYAKAHLGMEGKIIVRPFYPGGDFENFPYPENCAVVDNPPFSIYAKIVRFYCAHNIPFLLFGPHLTMIVSGIEGVTYILANADITYENGAVVRTGFITNTTPHYALVAAPELGVAIEKAQERERERRKIAKLKYPSNVITTGILGKIVKPGIEFSLKWEEAECVGNIDNLKALGKSLFGVGLLISDRKAAELKAAELKAAELKAAEDVIHIRLSDRERNIVEDLNRKSN